MTRRGPRSELEVGLVRASLLASGSGRGLEKTRQAVEVPGAPRGLEIILAPGIDAPSQGWWRGPARRKMMAQWHNLAQTRLPLVKPLSYQSHALSAVPKWLCHKG